MVAAGPLLGEAVRPQGWIGALLGFVGVMLVARPGSGLESWGGALTLTSAVFSAGYQLLTRALTNSETTMAMMFHTEHVETVVFTAMTLCAGTDAPPQTADFGLMLALDALTPWASLLYCSLPPRRWTGWLLASGPMRRALQA